MVDRIDTTHASPLQPNDPIHLLAQELRSHVLSFIESLTQILKDPSQTQHAAFLQKFASNGRELHQILHQINQMAEKKLKENGEILSSILNQHVMIPGIEKNTTLLDALEKFASQIAESSDLSKLLGMFASNPELCQTLIRELRLIAHDLKEIA